MLDKENKGVENWYDAYRQDSTFGNRLADRVAKGMGSWRFIIWQSVFVVIWMSLNIASFAYHWDVYPFILLNLVFSTQAAYAAPVIMMSQNRQSERDRKKAEANYKVNLKSKHQLEDLTQLHVNQNKLYLEQNKEIASLNKALKSLLKELDSKRPIVKI